MLYSGREKIDQMDSEQFLYDGGLCINILLHLEYHNENTTGGNRANQKTNVQ